MAGPPRLEGCCHQRERGQSHWKERSQRNFAVLCPHPRLDAVPGNVEVRPKPNPRSAAGSSTAGLSAGESAQRAFQQPFAPIRYESPGWLLRPVARRGRHRRLRRPSAHFLLGIWVCRQAIPVRCQEFTRSGRPGPVRANCATDTEIADWHRISPLAVQGPVPW